jgi:hypothetical protein
MSGLGFLDGGRGIGRGIRARARRRCARCYRARHQAAMLARFPERGKNG